MAGTNIFKTSGQSFDNKTRFGYHVGVYADIPLTGRLGLHPELLMNEISSKTSDQFNNIFHGASFQDVTMNYVTLPVLLTYRVSDIFTILVGPQYGYLVYQTPGLTEAPARRTRSRKMIFRSFSAVT